MSAEKCGLDDVCGCAFVCVLAVTSAPSGGSSEALTVNRSSWTSADRLAGAHALYHSNIFPDTNTHTHTHTGKWTLPLMYSYITLICWPKVSLSLSLSLSAPLSLTVGPPACFTVSRKRAKPVLSFPPLHSKLPGWENRLLSPLSKSVPALGVENKRRRCLTGPGGLEEPADCRGWTDCAFYPLSCNVISSTFYLLPDTQDNKSAAMSPPPPTPCPYTSQPAVIHHSVPHK